MLPIKNLNNVLQGAVLRSQISNAKSDGKVTGQEMQGILQRARAGGVTPSELQALRQLAIESRNNASFDPAAKAALNKFLGRSADASHASGRLPPQADLPQRIFGGLFDKARLAALDKHFKKDDGMIGRSEARSILRNIFKDGNVSPAERQYLQSKLKDPNVSAEAKKDIRLVLSMLPGSRFTKEGDLVNIPWPRFTGFPFPRPPTTGTAPSTGTGGTTPPPPTSGTGGTTPPPPTSGTGGTTPPPSTQPAPSTGSNNPTQGWSGGPPDPSKYKMDTPEGAAKFQQDNTRYQQTMNNIQLMYSTLSNTLAAMASTAKAIGANVRI